PRAAEVLARRRRTQVTDRMPTGSGDGPRAGSGLVAKAPADDKTGRDPEHFRGEAGAELGAAGLQHLHVAADLDAAHPPRADRCEVVAHERNLGMRERVTVLLAPAEVVAADVDGVERRVVPEAGRHHVRRAVGAYRRQPSKPRVLQIPKLRVGEDAHPASSRSGQRLSMARTRQPMAGLRAGPARRAAPLTRAPSRNARAPRCTASVSPSSSAAASPSSQ